MLSFTTMSNIEEYLKRQRELSEKKNVNPTKIVACTSKSRELADSISKKQRDRPILKTNQRKINSVKNKRRKNDSFSEESSSLDKFKEDGCEPTDLKLNESCIAERIRDKPSKKLRQSSCHESEEIDSDEGSEYIPSSEEDETENKSKYTYLKHHNNNRSVGRREERIHDDGNIDIYKKRMELWNTAKKKTIAHLKSCEGESQNESVIKTVDIDYILKGNIDYDEFRELSGGLLIPVFLWKQLFKYQRTGVKWLWELHQINSGGLLGDEMGLGKTVQIIAFLSALSFSRFGAWNGLGPSIIVAPATVVYQWVSHFHYWCPHLRVAVLHQSGSFQGRPSDLIRDIHDAHGVLVVTYAGVIKYKDDLMNRKWHYLILDEGHKIRNPETQISKILKKYMTPHRIIISGSPMQNNLQELWSLFDFMSPGLLGSLPAFLLHFSLPITQGGFANATKLQEVTAFQIARTLKNIITPYMIRRTKSGVKESLHLPDKNEQVLFCSMSDEQKDLYKGYLYGATVRSILDKDNRYGDPLRARIFVALSTLRKICNHPDLYTCEVQDDADLIMEGSFGHWRRSGKMIVVNSLLKIWKKQGHRALIFTQSRAMLYVLENFLQQNNYNYLKMDGTISIGLRQNLVKSFNEDNKILVFLATTRVGGLGVNLTGADRVIIYDPDWNPATDTQAKERAWRIGQTRNVTVYRLLSAGTIEEKIYQRQVFKQLLSNKVLLDPNQKNLLKTSNLQGLFTLEEPNHDGDTETSSIFKHTKVDMNKATPKNDKVLLTGGLSFSQVKMQAMRKMAHSISRNLFSHSTQDKRKEPEPSVDPRERYKLKRFKLLNREPEPEEPKVNVVDDSVTDVSFNSLLSELDIINMHTIKDYEKKLIEEKIASLNENISETTPNLETSNVTSCFNAVSDEQPNILTKDVSNLTSCLDFVSDDYIPNNLNENVSNEEKIKTIVTPIKDENLNEDSLEKSISDMEVTQMEKEETIDCIENVVARRKVKKKKKIEMDQDEYVLSKLFAKSGVQNALEHDKIVGLAEKEDQYRLEEEAKERARNALRALRKSRKKDRRM